jgi:hypothetical protein
MDPHAEGGPPTVEVAEVEVEFDLKVSGVFGAVTVLLLEYSGPRFDSPADRGHNMNHEQQLSHKPTHLAYTPVTTRRAAAYAHGPACGVDFPQCARTWLGPASPGYVPLPLPLPLLVVVMFMFMPLTLQDADLEKVRAFQEEEFQRRLRGEREQAQARVGEVVSKPKPEPVNRPPAPAYN